MTEDWTSNHTPSPRIPKAHPWVVPIQGAWYTVALHWLKRHWDTSLFTLCSVALFLCLTCSLIPKPIQSFQLVSQGPPNWITAQLNPTETMATSGETGEGLSEGESTASQSARPNHKAHTSRKKTPKTIPIIHINQANTALWSEMPGIGPKMAERIMQYKKANGSFQSVEDLLNVKGIGAKKLEKMRPYLKL